MTAPITIPLNEEIFRNLPNAKRFAIDIGGSLTKIAYYSTVSIRKITGNDDDQFEISEKARLHFIKFETKFIQQCLDFVQKLVKGDTGEVIKATGGGAYKYSNLIQEKLGLTVDKEDEVSCLILGANFLLKNVSDEAFTFHRKQLPEYRFLPKGPVMFPYLLVNVGSGVSILKVESEDKYERIGGTATGGGTFWGLGSLVTGVNDFDKLLEMAENGDHRNVDMLVKDIYSGDYIKLGLPGDLIASSFGKLTHSTTEHKPEDIVRSLLYTISNDLGQIACLYAMQHNLKRVYFGGYFLRNHPLTMHAVSYSIRYWSKGLVEALFLRHEGYLGAIGAFLKGLHGVNEYSWVENFAGSFSSFECENMTVEQLEIDRAERPMCFFPLLSNEEEYFPDAVDLTKDEAAREYWVNCFESSLERITSKAMESQPLSATSTERALRCRQKLMSRCHLLKDHPCAYGTLTVRSLLDTIEQCLREFDFPDPYLEQKMMENNVAEGCFEDRIKVIDAISDEQQRFIDIFEGVMAGNVFDWGAKEVATKLEGPEVFGFEEARNQLEKRPWLVDDLEKWLQRIATGKPHKCVAIFVDNSGFDFVLGIIPLCREFLKRGTKVILCANSTPALNDMTIYEMIPLTSRLAAMCSILKDNLESGNLLLLGTGQGSPCLDLARISQDIIDAIFEKETDLVILEGMGRSIHTNLNAKFNCEVVKVAVIKNKWLAERLGGKLYSVVFSYT